MKNKEAKELIRKTIDDVLEHDMGYPETSYIMYFIEQVLHGSDEHALWLAKAGENYIYGRDINFENEYKK